MGSKYHEIPRYRISRIILPAHSSQIKPTFTLSDYEVDIYIIIIIYITLLYLCNEHANIAYTAHKLTRSSTEVNLCASRINTNLRLTQFP